MTENEIGTRVIEAAIAVHRELGPGLLETVYEVVLARELTERGLNVVRQAPVPICCDRLGQATSAPQRLCGRNNTGSNNRLLRRRDTVASPLTFRTVKYGS